MDKTKVREPDRMAPCHGCGVMTPLELLDSKPPAGADPETADFTVLECEKCYGPGWLPM